MAASTEELAMAVCSALRCERSALERLDVGPETGLVGQGFSATCGTVTVDAVVRGRPHRVHLFVKRSDQTELIGPGDDLRERTFFSRTRPLLERAWRRGGSNAVPDEVADGVLDGVPDLGPAVYLGPSDDAGDALFMEDLATRGYVSLGNWPWTGLDFETMRQVLRALARLHASSLVAERCHAVDFRSVDPLLLEETVMTHRPGSLGRRVFDAAVDGICNYLLPLVFPRLSVPQTVAERQRLVDATRALFARLEMDVLRDSEPSGVLAVTHGDSWPNNVLVRRDEKGHAQHAALVDFQLVRLAPPAFDVVMMIHQALRRDFLRQHKDGLLQEYHADLSGFCRQRGLDISTDFDQDTFLASAARLWPLGAAIAAAYKPLIAGRAQDLAAVFADPEQRGRIFLDGDLKGELISKWFNSEGEPYRQLLQELVEEMLGL